MNLECLLWSLSFHRSRHLVLVAWFRWTLLNRLCARGDGVFSLVHQNVVWDPGERPRFSTVRGICRKTITVIRGIRRRCSQQRPRINCEETQGSLTIGIKATGPDETRTPGDSINVQALPS